MSKRDHAQNVRQLLEGKRWAALATLAESGEPEASMVAYVMSEDLTEAFLHLSTLAAHTRNLAKHPQTSLVISECDLMQQDPQQLARATLSGTVSVIDPAAQAYEQAKQRYLAHLPDAEPLFDFADFRLFRLSISKIRYVGGFAQAFTYSAGDLSAV